MVLTEKQIQEEIEKSGGLIKASELRSLGLTPFDIHKLCDTGFLSRIEHGYYYLSNQGFPSSEQLLQAMLPEGIVCMDSALFYYGYSDFTPREWSMAVPRTIARSKTKLTSVFVKTYFFEPNIYELGKTNGTFSNASLAIYDRERVICDCFKFYNKMDRETFIKAVKAYANDPEKNIANLVSYAKALRVYQRVMYLMETMLNQ